MKLKVKTKLRNEKDELQVDDVSPLFSTINEGINSGEVNTNKKLYRHVFRLRFINYDGYIDLISREYISTRSTKYFDGTMGSMQEYVIHIWNNLFSGLTFKTEQTYQNPKYVTLGRFSEVVSPYDFRFNILGLLKYIGGNYTLEGAETTVQCTLQSTTPQGVIYRLEETVEEL